MAVFLAGISFTLACLSAPPEAASPAASATAWLNLLHYRPQGGGLYRSDVSDARFFVSATGRDDPQAELQASLGRLHGALPDAREFACAFPARTRWLEARFGITSTPGSRRCPELARWKAEIDARGVTLLFASAYMGSPSSMFGHTLLRFDSDRPALLSYAVNFAASVPAEDRLSYPFKGLTGRYTGQFSVLPYYQKLREYQHLEQRAMWEYRLPLTVAQTEILVDHIWELKEIRFPYYFLDENCGSRMLDILGVIEPYKPIAHSPGRVVVPQDVFKMIVAQGAERGTVHLVSPRAELIAATDTGITAPNAGHASSRTEIGAGRITRGGHRTDALFFTLAGGYHTPLDPPDGYLPNAGIDFFRLGIRGANGSLRIESADVVEIQSLQNPASEAWSSVWRAGLGLSRRHVPHSLEHDVLSLQSHLGAGYGLRAGPMTIFGMLELRVAGALQSTAVGLGPRLGFAYPGPSGLTLTGAAGRQRFVDGGRSVDSMEIAAGRHLDADHTVVGELLLTRGDGIPMVRSLMLGLRRYF
ncbi:MAG: DUF4105 domain-containing protein [Zoogloea sp.]|nr:DUF4105 domain-containing protein [Zoogloea sp.]